MMALLLQKDSHVLYFHKRTKTHMISFFTNTTIFLWFCVHLNLTQALTLPEPLIPSTLPLEIHNLSSEKKTLLSKQSPHLLSVRESEWFPKVLFYDSYFFTTTILCSLGLFGGMDTLFVLCYQVYIISSFYIPKSNVL